MNPQLRAIAKRVEAGKITPAIDRIFPLAALPEAMRDLEMGGVRGKVAITV